MPTALYYMHDPFAPKPNQPTRFGAAVIMMYQGKILLQQRKDNLRWGIISGDIRDTETFKDCAIRRTIEETNIHLKDYTVSQFKIFDDPTRIVSFLDGNIYRVVSVAFYAELQEEVALNPGKHGFDLRWVDPIELEDYDIVVTHQEIIEQYLQYKGITNTLKRSIRE